MKKNIILGIIITILVVCVAVEGFFLWKQSSDKKKEERKGDTEQVEQTPSPEPSKEPKKLPKDEVIDGENIKISKKYSNPKKDELVYTYLTVTIEEKEANAYRYVYEIPQINLESEEVEKINEEILQKYEDIINKVNEEQFIDMTCESLAYSNYENDGILSLLMINATEDGGFFNCETYNIDISAKKEIDNSKIIEKVNLDKTKFNDKILKSIEGAKIYSVDASGYADYKDFAKEQESRTINKYKNVSVDKVELYLNEKKNLCAYLEVYALAGGDTMTILLDLETNEIINLDRNIGLKNS